MGTIHLSWPAAATSGGGSSVIAAKDHKSSAPGISVRVHRQATCMCCGGVGSKRSTTFWPSRFTFSKKASTSKRPCVKPKTLRQAVASESERAL